MSPRLKKSLAKLFKDQQDLSFCAIPLGYATTDVVNTR